MTAVSVVINRALRICKIIDIHDATPAVWTANAITALNQLVNRWEANGLALGWSDVTAPDDTLPAPVEAEEPIVYQLALRLNGESAGQMSDDDKGHAKTLLAELRRDRLTEMPLKLASDLPCSERGGWFNIYTDEPYRG